MVVNKTHTQAVADYLRYIPRNLRYYRQKRGITQVKLSKQCGISPATLYRAESEGTLFVGRTDVLIKIAVALNIQPSLLFKEREEMPVLRGWAAQKALGAANRTLTEAIGQHVP
jgi:transcriptional regulator with XRE-family HTH domain